MFIVGDSELTFGKFLLGLQLENFISLCADAVVRDKCDAKPDARQIDQKVIARQLDLWDEVQLMLLEYLMEKFVGRAVFVQHQDGIAQELCKG